jgi:hypothetical protein
MMAKSDAGFTITSLGDGSEFPPPNVWALSRTKQANR